MRLKTQSKAILAIRLYLTEKSPQTEKTIKAIKQIIQKERTKEFF
jgi:hypothetical protein